MKRPTKFVDQLNEEQKQRLKDLMKTGPNARVRMRAHAILLSNRQYSVDQIADIFEADRDRVSEWLNWWAESQFDGIDDDPRSGRPPKLSEKEQKDAIKFVKEEPRSSQRILDRIEEEIGKQISDSTLKRIFHRGGLVWKRVRRSLTGFRDEADFRAAQAELLELRADAATGEFNLWYYDESGFCLQPVVPYAWQKIGETIRLPATHSPRLNVLGFLNPAQQRFRSLVIEGSVDSSVVVYAFDQLASTIRKPTIVVVDNAPTHTSGEFEENIERWQERELFVKFLPSYCPELNLIEILWRKIKYEWLPFSAYDSFEALYKELMAVLSQVGSKYRITFA